MLNFEDLVKRNYIEISNNKEINAQYFAGKWYVGKFGEHTISFLVADIQEIIFQSVGKSVITNAKLLQIIERSYEPTIRHTSTQFFFGVHYKERWGCNTLEHLIDDLQDELEFYSPNKYFSIEEQRECYKCYS